VAGSDVAAGDAPHVTNQVKILSESSPVFADFIAKKNLAIVAASMIAQWQGRDGCLIPLVPRPVKRGGSNEECRSREAVCPAGKNAGLMAAR